MRKWAPLAAVCLGTFMLLVDVTIVNVALPDMAVDLHTSFSSLQWVIDSYAVALAALLMGLGSLADLRGRRRVYLAGLAVFAAASLASGLAASPGLLIAARGVQGIGGAAMFATTIALLNASYQGRDRGTAFGVWGAVAGASAAVGPVLGGLLTEALSWRWIFFVNLPVSAVAVALTLAAFGADRSQATARFDLAGVLAFTAGAAATTFGLVRASSLGWAAGQTIGLIAAGLAAFVIFVLIESRARQPLLQVSLLRRPAFAAVMIAALLLNAAAFAYLAYSSLWLQTVLGLSPVQAGLAGAAPMSLSAFVVSAAIGRFLHASNPRWIIGGGMALVGAGALLQAGLGADRLAAPGARPDRGRDRGGPGHADAGVQRHVGRAGAQRRDGGRCGQHHAPARLRVRDRGARQRVLGPGGPRSGAPGRPPGRGPGHHRRARPSGCWPACPRASGTRWIRSCTRPRPPGSTRRSCSPGRSAWQAA